MSDESESLSASSTTTTTSSSGVIMTTAMPTTQAPSTPISSVSPTDGYEVPNGHLSPTDLANGMMGGGEPAGHMYVPPGAPHGMQNPRPTQRSHSPVRYSPNGQSRGNSPQGQGMQSHSPPGLQHVVHVHVNPGETFSVRVGDQIQHIQGPATVRMVSNNGPPLPMPMQVPPGHMVQQIVDENGILTHVILSPQPPGMPGPPLTGGPNGSQQMYGYGGPQYATFPQHQFPAHHHHPHTGAPTHIHPMPQPHIQSTTPCSNHGHHVHTQGPAPHHHNHIHDERTQRQHDRLRSKLQQRQEKGHYTSRSRHTKGKMNGDVKRPDTTNSSSSSADGQDMEEEKTQEERKLIWELLSKMQSPKVSDVESRSALIELIPPELDQADYNIDPSEYQYELLLSDKGKEGKYKLVYSGDATQITLKDLKPATEYFLKVCSQLEDLKGEQTEYVSFKTDACEPDRPQPPKLSHKQKSSLQLKWNATPDNGSKISCYTLEYDEGRGDGKFSEIYNGLPRQYKVTKLIPATGYTFRLAAVNAIGKSEFSEPVCFYTSGSVPTQPEPPQLIRQGVVELALHWTKRPNDEDFTLQMEDEATGHGYLTVYNGPDLRHTVKPLKRNTEYRFRLSAKNEEGSSKPSEPVCYCTLPDRPAAPHRPQLKGKPHTHSFRLTWDAPWDTGGSDITGYRLELDEGRGFELVYSGIDQDYTCDHLTPGHTYRVRVSCNSAGGPSEWSEPLAVTTQAVEPGHCAPPKLHGKPKAMSLQLKWNYPDYDGGSNVTEFRIQMTLPDNTTREVYRGPDLVCTVAGLSPGRPYLFQVRAGNKAGVGPWSDILDVISGPGVPDPPKCPQTHCRSAHCVLVSWEEPVNNGATITEYRLEWQAKPDSEFTQLYCGSGLNHEIRGLQPASLYSFRVQALNSAGAGPFSELASCTTPPSSPAAVTSVRASATADTISLMWKAPPDNGSEILSYNIDLGEKTLLTVGNLHEFVIENLLPETAYKIRVQAVNGIGVGAFSTPVKVTTRSLPPSPPGLECVNCGPNSLKLKWGDGKNPDMVQYVLEMLRENGSFHTVYHGHGHSHKVNKLSELTTYQFRIYAANAAGDGPHSDVFIFTTTKAPPPAVKPPRVVEVTLDSCQLEWTPLKPMGKDLLTYTLQLAHSKDAEYKKVYHGPSTSHKLTGLCARSTYQVRVCATRVCADGSQDLTGANSPGVEFTTHAPKPLVYSQPTSAIQSKMEPKQWTDHQWACIILSGFAIFAIVIAFLAQQLISYTSNSSSSSQ